MRTGAEYREALRDGRKVFVMGDGRVDDVTTHPATAAMVEQYVAWYDRHFDPAWADTLLAARSGKRRPGPLCCRRPRGRPGRHRPVDRQDDVPQRRQHHPHAAIRPSDRARRADRGRDPQRRPAARRQRDGLPRAHRRHRPVPHLLRRRARSIGQRLQPDPADRVAVKMVRENDRASCRGRLGMHTSPAYAEDVYVGALTGLQIDGHPAGLHRAGRRAGGHDSCAASRRCATPTRSSRRCRAATTSSTARCGSTTCSSRGSGSSRSTPSPRRSRAGCAGTTSTAGWRRPSSPSAWPWR